MGFAAMGERASGDAEQRKQILISLQGLSKP